jgi:hypothetical protein
MMDRFLFGFLVRKRRYTARPRRRWAFFFSLSPEHLPASEVVRGGTKANVDRHVYDSFVPGRENKRWYWVVRTRAPHVFEPVCCCCRIDAFRHEKTCSSVVRRPCECLHHDRGCGRREYSNERVIRQGILSATARYRTARHSASTKQPTNQQNDEYISTEQSMAAATRSCSQSIGKDS